ncbi:MAG: sulfotransferase domain-containing protein [Chloroflexi bacterium]|nr:sulfotransferase domain-containing protein [Chloroflexota bacterium]
MAVSPAPAPVLRAAESENPEEKVYLVSYPKSGRTWLRVLLSRYKQLLLGVEDFELKLHASYSETPLVTRQYIFSHADSAYTADQAGWPQKIADRLGWLGRVEYPFSLERFRGAGVIFLVRDPRDVTVSDYHQQVKRSKEVPPMPLSRFIRSRLFGVRRPVAFLNYIAHQRAEFKHMFTHYEDLHRDPTGELTRMLEFAGLPLRPELVQESVDYARFENMRKMEAKGGHGVKLAPADHSDRDTYKTRKGRIGSFREELTGKDIRAINAIIQDELDGFFQRYKQPDPEPL